MSKDRIIFRDCLTWTIRLDSFTVAPPSEDTWRPSGGAYVMNKECAQCIEPNSKDNFSTLMFPGGFERGKRSAHRDYSGQDWCECPDELVFTTIGFSKY